MHKMLKKSQIAFLKSVYGESDAKQSSRRNTENIARLNVYRHSYYGRFQTILKEFFPVSHQFIEPERFSNLVNQYLTFSKLNNKLIQDVGYQFPRFLKWIKENKSQGLFINLIFFESLVTQSHMAKEMRPSVEKNISAYDETWFEEKPFIPSAVKIIRSHYLVGQIWSACKKKTSYPKLTYQFEALNYIIYRNIPKVFFLCLTSEELHLLKSFQSKKTPIKIYQNNLWALYQIQEWLKKGVLCI